MNKWFYWDWWKYLFSPASDYFSTILFWEVILCRLQGHPYRLIGMTGEYEFDYRCSNCGDEI